MQASPRPLIHPCQIPITFPLHPCHPCHPCCIPIAPTVAHGARGGWHVVISPHTIHLMSSCSWGWGHVGCCPWWVWWWSAISAPWCLGQRGLGRHQWGGMCQGVGRCLLCGYPTPGIACHPPVPKQHPSHPILTERRGAGAGVGGSGLSPLFPSSLVD